MSNYLAVATVSAALQQILLGPVGAAVTGARVRFRRPDGNETADKEPVVNIYLYRVSPNAAYRNVDLPTRRGDGSLAKRVLTALDLHYLLTFHGSDDKLEPQRMLGAVASALDFQPLLSTDNVQSAYTEFSFLKTSGLENQAERVRFTPTELSLEEFTKLWSAFFQVEYSLSAAYQASVVLIESESTPEDALPVQARNIYVLPFQQPAISRVTSTAGPNALILPTSTLLIQGQNLQSDFTSVQIGSQTVTPSKLTESTITFPVPTGLQAGVVPVQVVQTMNMGTPALPHPGFESNVAAVVLHPVITPNSASTAEVVVKIDPPVQPTQRVSLLLNQTTAPGSSSPAAYSFTLPPLAASSGILTFPVSNVQGGGTTYFIRVTVDGASSPLDLTPSSPTFGPTVNIA